MMYKVLFKDQYTSGYAKKIAGSYTLVAGFLIRQYPFQHTCCILKELWGLLMLCGRHVYGTLTVVAGFLIPHYTSPYIWCILHEAGRVLIVEGAYCGALTSLFWAILMGKFTILEYSYGVRSVLKIFALLRCDLGGIIKSWIISCHASITNSC